MIAFAVLAALPFVAAHPKVNWYQPRDSPVHELFRRADVDITAANFTAGYPPLYMSPNATNTPQAWIDKLNSITLPSANPVAVQTGTANPKYDVANGTDGSGPDICSFTSGCHTDTDLFHGPDNTFVLTFDDGPSDVSQDLYDFLKQNNINGNATHFMIGTNIVGDPATAKSAFTNGGHMAVHTWSHPYMTTRTNEQVVGELGWTMQIIADVTGGHIPAFWRPPYGDVDNRVRAIAKEVFGLTTVLWNHDTNDWAIGAGGNFTIESVEATMDTWFVGPRSPGILALEHEINNNSLIVFKHEYPGFAANNWTIQSVADAFGMDWYQNAVANGAIASTMSVGDIQTAMFTNQSQTATAGATGASGSAAGNSTASGSGSAGASATAATTKAGSAMGIAAPVAAVVGAAVLAVAF